MHDRIREVPIKRPGKRGGRASRQKGNRTERALVRYLQDRGFAAHRVPLSGSAGGRYRGDVIIPLLGRDLITEVKCRANGYRNLYAGLEHRDLLIVRADRREPLLIIRLGLGAELVTPSSRKCGPSSRK